MKAKEILTPKLCKPVISLRPWQGLEGLVYMDICERELFVSKIASKMESPAVNIIESFPPPRYPLFTNNTDPRGPLGEPIPGRLMARPGGVNPILIL
jgi:hypothetical protein